MDEESIKKIFREVHAELEEKAKPEREAARNKLNSVHFAIGGNKDLGVKGIIHQLEDLDQKVQCISDYKSELKLVRWMRKTAVYIFVAGIITGIGIFLREHIK